MPGAYSPANPLTVQNDKTLLLETNHPRYEEARHALTRFAELRKAPGQVHIYRLTPLSLWNAAASGMTAAEILDVLTELSQHELPHNVRVDVADYVSRYGRVKLINFHGHLALRSPDTALLERLAESEELLPYLLDQPDSHTILVDPGQRGSVKQILIRLGYPAEDLAGYATGAPLPLHLRKVTGQGKEFDLRDYQWRAVERFRAEGSGVVVLPCGAGKTLVGLGIMSELQSQTLVLATNIIAVRQWIEQILDKTSLSVDEVGEYSGERKDIRPVTIATYQVTTHRASFVDTETGEIGDRPHLSLFSQGDWGLIIYDEVHLLPAPVFRMTAEIQARRRLGLTATLVREDGREADVFALIGPQRYHVPWRALEKEGWIATAHCHEIRLDMEEERRLLYATSPKRQRYRVAAENPAKLIAVRALAERHAADQVLVIGQYLRQLDKIATMLKAPLITGRTPNVHRSQLYDQFRRGDIRCLVVSRVANFSVDLPAANVAIQVSGTFGSRQEEAQRLGRLLRPKADGAQAHFYTLVTRDSKDQEYAAKRQRFLVEQGYVYTIHDHL